MKKALALKEAVFTELFHNLYPLAIIVLLIYILSYFPLWSLLLYKCNHLLD